MSNAFIEIFHLIIQSATSLLVAACILRAYMIFIQLNMRSSSGNPIGQFVLNLTNWIVLPLRKIFPVVGKLDTSSILAAYLFCVAELILFSLIIRFNLPNQLLLLVALGELLKITFSVLTILLLIYTITSWLSANSANIHFLDRLLSPLLNPIRKFLPLIGGIDFSPMVLFLLIQIVKILINALIGESHSF